MLALAIFGGGIASSFAKSDAGEKLRKAQNRHRAAFNYAKSTYNETATCVIELATTRQASLMLLQPCIDKAVSQLSAQHAFYGKKHGIFGGRSLQQIKALVQRSRNLLIVPSSAFDNAVAVTSGAALLIEGVQYLDKVGTIHAPALHQSLGEAFGSLTGEGPDAFAGALGGVANIGVADLVGDGLLIFSVFKFGYNLWRISDLGDQQADHDREASRLYGAAYSLSQLCNEAREINSAVHEAGYATYKWTFLTGVVARGNGLGQVNLREQLERRLRKASSLWWQSMQRAVSQA